MVRMGREVWGFVEREAMKDAGKWESKSTKGRQYDYSSASRALPRSQSKELEDTSKGLVIVLNCLQLLIIFFYQLLPISTNLDTLQGCDETDVNI